MSLLQNVVSIGSQGPKIMEMFCFVLFLIFSESFRQSSWFFFLLPKQASMNPCNLVNNISQQLFDSYVSSPKCLPQAHVLKAWLPACDAILKAIGPLEYGVWRAEVCSSCHLLWNIAASSPSTPTTMPSLPWSTGLHVQRWTPRPSLSCFHQVFCQSAAMGREDGQNVNTWETWNLQFCRYNNLHDLRSEAIQHEPINPTALACNLAFKKPGKQRKKNW